jgi:hypothetical protein
MDETKLLPLKDNTFNSSIPNHLVVFQSCSAVYDIVDSSSDLKAKTDSSTLSSSRLQTVVVTLVLGWVIWYEIYTMASL